MSFCREFTVSLNSYTDPFNKTLTSRKRESSNTFLYSYACFLKIFTCCGTLSELLRFCVSIARPLENCIKDCVTARLSDWDLLLHRGWGWGVAAVCDPDVLREPWAEPACEACPHEGPTDGLVLLFILNLAGTTFAAESRASKVITHAATTMKP